MTRLLLLALSTALLTPLSSAFAMVLQTPSKVGDEVEITRSYETSQQSDDDMSSGSSHGRTTILERVVAVRDGGIELIYDLPKDSTDANRAREWHFPALVFRTSSGPVQLLNSPQLEARLELWLKAAKWTRAMCGRTIFTWNAFRIECDPQAILDTIATYDLRSADIREGAPYREEGSLGPSPLVKVNSGPTSSSLSVTMEIDPDFVRRARAETDVTVAEIMRKPTTLEAALRERAKEKISGTIAVSFDLDVRANVIRRTKLTTIRTVRANGRIENETMKEVTERTRASDR